ncbi:uncharacterized protein LOC129760328 [Uranotaenia lowii]|uniref:uncharacterized protein LOC129760328 n=1 Tax=Uranotaenia lowii TaxID=190385 RepID=UPI002479A17F|nr:uncharacterized protein LOC129760328 [Uranotaenia lowii]
MGDNPPVWGGRSNPPANRNLRTLPNWMDPRGEFGDVIFLCLKPNSPAKLPKNPFIISLSIEKAAGKIEGGNPTDGGENYLLKVRNPSQVNLITKIDRLIDGTPITIELHPTLNTCQCVVSCGDVDGLSDQDLQKYLHDQGVVKVYRFVRKSAGKTTPTNSMVLTVNGSVPPPFIYFGFLRVATRPYYPRPLMCYKCGQYGHSKNRCKNDPICIDCGTNCEQDECPNPPQCINCGGNHSAINRLCPIYKQEQAIVRLKVDLGLSQSEATKEYRKQMKQHHEAKQLTQSSTIENDNRIRELEILVSQLQSELAKHRASDNESTLIGDTTTQASEDSGSDLESPMMTPRKNNITSTPKRSRQNSSIDSPSESTYTTHKKKPNPFLAPSTSVHPRVRKLPPPKSPPISLSNGTPVA